MATLILSISGARGIVGAGLDARVAARLASSFREQIDPGMVVIGRDSRPSGPELVSAVAASLKARGCRIRDLGIVPTPTVQVTVEALAAQGGVVVTASHNPAEWNALKFIGPDGVFLGSAAMGRLISRFQSADEAVPLSPAPEASSAASATSAAGAQAIAHHIERILTIVPVEEIRAAQLGVVVDAVHGAGAVLIAPLLEALGVNAEWIAAEPNGQFPEHPEPRAELLEPLRERVVAANAQVGFALDPDGDRCAAVLPQRVLGEEWTLPLCAVVRLQSGERGPLVTNLSSSAMLTDVAARFGVKCLRTPVGEAHVVTRARAAGALLAGEGNGGVIDPRVHYGRDAGVAVATLLALEAGGPSGRGGIAREAERFAKRIMLKQKVALATERFGQLSARVCAELGPPTNREDGLHWDWAEAWLHLRPSGTEPVLRVVAEARTREEAERLTARIHRAAEELASS